MKGMVNGSIGACEAGSYNTARADLLTLPCTRSDAPCHCHRGAPTVRVIHHTAKRAAQDASRLRSQVVVERQRLHPAQLVRVLKRTSAISPSLCSAARSDMTGSISGRKSTYVPEKRLRIAARAPPTEPKIATTSMNVQKPLRKPMFESVAGAAGCELAAAATERRDIGPTAGSATREG